jgi:hypothetical protein
MYLSFQIAESAFVSYVGKKGEEHPEKEGFSYTAFVVVQLTEGHKEAQKAQKQPKSFVLLCLFAIAVSEPLSTSQMLHPKTNCALCNCPPVFHFG